MSITRPHPQRGLSPVDNREGDEKMVHFCPRISPLLRPQRDERPTEPVHHYAIMPEARKQACLES